jgi:tagatose 1,6-diphosphate aldolase GatY/KbaY
MVVEQGLARLHDGIARQASTRSPSEVPPVAIPSHWRAVGRRELSIDRRRLAAHRYKGDVARALERESTSPAIVQLHPASMAFGGTALIAACLDVAASCKGAQLYVQLDHASEEAPIRDALGAGIDGILADGSGLDLRANAAWTARMAALAHEHGVCVEAELGKLAGEEDGLAVDVRDSKMTDPGAVAEFLAETAVDTLAVTIGNVHGKYHHNPPLLDWARLDAVRVAAGATPLVLHGASGLPVEMLHRAIGAGICKLNVNTEVRAAAVSATVEASVAGRDLLDSMKHSTEAMAAVVEGKLRAFRGA